MTTYTRKCEDTDKAVGLCWNEDQVVFVKKGSWAEEVGIEAGDKITILNGRPFHDLKPAERMVTIDKANFTINLERPETTVLINMIFAKLILISLNPFVIVSLSLVAFKIFILKDSTSSSRSSTTVYLFVRKTPLVLVAFAIISGGVLQEGF